MSIDSPPKRKRGRPRKTEVSPTGETRRAIAARETAPFEKVLADLIDAAPTFDEIREQSARDIRGWAASVNSIGRILYDGPKVNVTVNAEIAAMSDLELELRLQQMLEGKRKTIEHQPGAQSEKLPGMA